MEQESISKVAVIGGGPAGCFCALLLRDYCDVTIFEVNSPLKTLLPTGGGRCNLAHNEFDFKELAKNYPRGEKFLYSVFSKFSTEDTLSVFRKLGVDTYTQEDGRIFPKSNSAADVRNCILKNLGNTKIIREKVLRVNKEPITVVTDCGSYIFDKVVIAVGGHSGYDCARFLGHTIVEPKASLTALKTEENFSKLAGVSVRNAAAMGLKGDILFTHTGISGPLVYKISSIRARDNFPYQIYFDFVGELDLQAVLNKNPHKDIKNIISEFVPKSFSEYILDKLHINNDKKACFIDGKTRDSILKILQNFAVTVISPDKGGEVVTSGGVKLDEVNPKTMESKIIEGVYFCGEVLDIDGFCGGFNLQNCWSTAYCAANHILAEK